MNFKTLTPEQAMIGLSKAVEERGGDYVQRHNQFVDQVNGRVVPACIVGQAFFCLGWSMKKTRTEEPFALAERANERVHNMWGQQPDYWTRKILNLAMECADNKEPWSSVLMKASEKYEEYREHERAKGLLQLQAVANQEPVEVEQVEECVLVK